ncbi:MAG: phosphate-starvation-inducible PsiE family protein [Euryarchaeota archaeon]|nr:phosphate-starvation-inducible PsiE family protein [Euryarchaeota archaeon]MBU4222967.1 phosphate-starvation-inducible PsiE family protein [Euryarchaeota archaeon]
MDHTKFFKKVIDSIVTIILYVLILVLIAGMLRILLDLRSVAIDSLEGGFNKIVTNVLTLFIVIEFFKTFADYSKHERIKLTDITDVTILIAMREVTVGLYSKSFGYETIFALSALLLVLGVIRVLAVKYSPEKIRE